MFQLFIGFVGVTVAALIVVLVRKDRLHVRHGFGWLIVAVGFACLGVAPDVTDYLARHLGISYPPVLALTLAIVLLVVKLLLMDIERSRVAMRNQRLTQRIAMLEADIRRIRAEMPGEEQEEQGN
ncbi:MAG: DUF2304 domain-containing protein [Halioglobus sp.]|nr:DUF2304 domain-containing protein [Halioglobus sp.]